MPQKNNILFFAPFNYRSRDNESLMLKFKELGHNVFFLTTLDGDYIIDFLQSNGIAAERMDIRGNGAISIFKRVRYLVKYIKHNRIDLVFSHLEPANFISALAQTFVKAKIIMVRHHVDEMKLTGNDKHWSYRFAYKRAKRIIAVSKRGRDFAIENEGADPKKIDVINLSYDFSVYEDPNPLEVAKLRKEYPGLIVLTASRMVKDKRPELSVEVCENVIRTLPNLNFLILGKGELTEKINSIISEKKLDRNCHVLGFKTNVMDYLEACDILLHPSALDSSSVIIKEAGLRKKVIIACLGIGDCDEYIKNGVNGFLVNPHNFVEEASNLIINALQDKNYRQEIGANLYKSIIERFSIENNIKYYNKYFK